MNICTTLLALALTTTPALADDTVTLTIENDAGMVTTVPDLTQRECDAAVVLMTTRRLGRL